MADDVTISDGVSSTFVAAADEIAGKKYQRVKISHGVDGSATDTSTTDPLPVEDADGNTALAAIQAAVEGTLTVTGGGGGTQYAEDAAHVSGNIGTMSLGVRKDTAAALAGTDGDYQPAIFDASGRQHVNVGTSVLPTGAATETSVALSATALGAPSDAAATTTGSVIAQLRRIANAIVAGLPASLGQKTMANSTGVVIASDQSAIPISGSITASGTLPIDATHAEDAAAASGDTGIPAFAVRRDTPSAGGADGDYVNLSVDSTGNLRVALASGSSITVSGTMAVSQALPVQSGTATLANVSGATSSTTLIASNANRKGLVIVNDSTAILYVKFGSTASSTSYTYLLAGSSSGIPATLELPAASVYTGIVTGIWASATGAARVTELT